MERIGGTNMLSRTARVWGALILFWGVVCAHLAGTEVPSADISEKLRQSKREFTQEILSSNNIFSRLLRNTRQRNGAQGRTLNVRSGSCSGAAECLSTPAVPLFFAAGSSGKNLPPFKENNFWTDFIISALPVRAGPLAA